MHELRNETEPELPALLERLAPCDLVLAESFKGQAIPKQRDLRIRAGAPGAGVTRWLH